MSLFLNKIQKNYFNLNDLIGRMKNKILLFKYFLPKIFYILYP